MRFLFKMSFVVHVFILGILNLGIACSPGQIPVRILPEKESRNDTVSETRDEQRETIDSISSPSPDSKATPKPTSTIAPAPAQPPKGESQIPTKVWVQAPVLVGSHSDIARVSTLDEFAFDSPVVTFMSGGERRFISNSVHWFADSSNTPDFFVFHSLSNGSLDQPFSNLIQIGKQWEVFHNPAEFPGRWWIVNLYQDGAGLLAFVHVEFANGLRNGSGQLNFGSTYIGLAWSNDGGKTFRYLGNIIQAAGAPEDHNIEGAPYLVKDGYFYVYFMDVMGVSVARAPKDAVLSAAQSGSSMPSWQKWNGGNWTPGMGGASTPLAVAGITHSDAAYSTATKKYYLTTTRQRKPVSPSSISLYESIDAINWKLLTDIEPLSNSESIWQYLSIIDQSGSDNGVVGSDFYIYVGKDPAQKTRAELFRFRVNLSTSPNPPPWGNFAKTGIYDGAFHAYGGMMFSNGSIYCSFTNTSHFTCATGIKDSSVLPYRHDIEATLPKGGPCDTPSVCR